MRQQSERDGADGAAPLAGMRDLLHTALEGRYGKPLGEDIAEAVGRADEPTLQAVAAHLTTDMLVDLRRRLGLQPAARTGDAKEQAQP